MPLELVINKDSKSKESHPESTAKLRSASDLHSHYENVTFDKDGMYKFATNDMIINNDSKLYIPKIKTRDIVLDTCSHLKSRNNQNSTSLQNCDHVRRHKF